MRSRAERTTLLAFAGVVLFGASNIVAVRFSNRELDPFWGAGLRFAVSGAVMFALVGINGLRVPRGRSLAGAVGYGALAFAFSYALFYVGVQRVPAGLAAVIMASVPLLTFILAVVQRLERFRWRGLIGAVVAMTGIALIAAEPPGGAVPLGSLLLVVGAAMTAAQSGIVVKRLPESHPITTNAVAMVTGSALLLAASVVADESPSLPTSLSVWIALVYLMVVGTPLLFICYLTVLERWSASAASYQFVLFPPVSVVLGAVLLGEPITTGLLLGVPFVLAGVYVGALSPAARRDRHATPSPRHVR
ncbi:MAG TPA: EamA family transporter [Actinomycetota bacterium]|nr:EamA family transporter [Actinomycetota bacterium]